MSYGILFLRLVLGLTVAAHGAQKLFGSFGGHGLRGTAESFAGLRFRAPYVLAFVAGAAELAGGLALAGGLLTPLAAFVIAVVMLNAIGTVHWRNGFFTTNGGYEYPLVIWSAAVALAATGGARFSLDALLGLDDDLSGLAWGLAVLAGSLLLSAGTLTIGRRELEVDAASAVEGGNGRARATRGKPSLPGGPPVEIRVGDEGEGNDLLDCLWRHGLPANLVESAGRWRVEVSSPREEPPELLGDLFHALETWVPDRAGSGILIRVGERRYVMRPQGGP
jgi:putative oxidoreductase